MTENVRPIPMRMDLPPELAAIALPAEDDEPPLVVLNASETKPGLAYREIRPGVFIPVLLGWAAEKPVEWVREHQHVATAVASSLSAAVIATAVNVALDGDDTPTAQPPATIVTAQVPPTPTATTVPPTTPEPTTTPTSSSTRTPPSVVNEPPTREEQPTAESTPNAPPERARSTPTPTPAPTAQPPTPEPQETSQAAQDVPVPTPQATDEPEEQPPAISPAPQEPPSATPEQDCAIRVDLDPILNVCVLS